ncbi:PD-(D/E)XK nuclease family protein [uncultured Maritimibacter sp.]|uniref:PD-(D/E)XK nuclease family protein n=1 Tax=uncultured Maritimibacter sp. TaxID=991866 RepID=UPI0025916869|nr:PD-(D/E)XK nuclease family protein [uncultured Maritimibacter sp.]
MEEAAQLAGGGGSGVGGVILSPESVMPIVSFNERDFDLLLIEELAFNPEFCAEFAKRFSVEAPAVAHIRHSVHENFGDMAWGETDIFVRFEDGTTLLIENKVSAQFQPDQAARYRARAKVHSVSGKTAKTVLIAPGAYLSGVVPEDWDYLCSYADLADCIPSGDARADWRRSLLRQAGGRAARVTALAGSAAARKAASAELAAFKAAWLDLIRQDGSWSANPQFGATDEFLYRPSLNRFGLTAWHHPMAGYVSIQNLEKTESIDLVALQASLPEGFRLSRHPKSVYLDAVVPSIDMSSPFSDEQEQVEDGMTIARKAIDLVEAAAGNGR